MPLLLLLSKKSFLYFLIFFVVAAGVLLAVYMGTNRNVSQALLTETIKRQLATTRTAAISVEEFIALSSRSLVLLAQTRQLTASSDERRQALDEYQRRREGTPITGVAVTDTKGLVVENSSLTGRQMVGIDLSDREYVVWASQAKEGETFVSKPVVSRLGASKGKEIITITTPLWENGRYQGALIAAITLEKFIDIYLSTFDPEISQAYLINANGDLLVSPNDSLAGKNIFTIIDESPIPGSNFLKTQIIDTMAKEEPGYLDTLIPVKGKLTRSLVTFAPIAIDSQKWMLVLVSPAGAVLAYAAPLYLQQLTLVIALFFLLLFLVLTLVRVIDFKHE